MLRHYNDSRIVSRVKSWQPLQSEIAIPAAGRKGNAMADTIAALRIAMNRFSSGLALDHVSRRAVIVALVCVLGNTQWLAADLVKLKGGGELRGVFVDSVRPGKLPTAPVRVTTLTGGTVTVNPEDVELVAKRSRLVEEYEWKARLTPSTVADHWRLQEWCRQNGLRKERELQLAAVLKLDPNHAESHRLLGHIKEFGQWMTRDDAMLAKGYVKYKGKYMFPQEVELLEQSAAERESAGNWHKRLFAIREILHSGNAERQQHALAELQNVTDVDAVGPLIKLFRNEPLDAVRLVFVKSLGRIGGGAAVQALVLQSLFDTSGTVRASAIEVIPKKERPQAIPIYLKGLKDELNEVVLRSAIGLESIGDEEVVPPLIEALITTHTYQVKVRETGYLAQGSYPSEMSTSIVINRPIDIPLTVPGVPVPMSTTHPGQLYNPRATVPQVVQAPPIVVQERIEQTTRPQQNLEVLSALRKLTKEDFGYDQRTWRIWWIAHTNK